MESPEIARSTKPSLFHLADLPASLVVFLVAVPLALGIANASGAPIASGLIGCIVRGIVVGLAKIPQGARVDIDLRVEFMDHAAFEALHSWRQTHEKSGGTVDIDEKHESWYAPAEGGMPRVTRKTTG